MRNAFVITIVTLALALTGLLGGYLFLIGTPYGREIVRGVIASEMSDALGGEATIGALRGRLPHEVVFNKISLSDNEGEWLTIDRLDIVWRPFKLIRGEIEIRSAAVSGGDLKRLPTSDGEEKPRLGGRRTLQLPTSLPAFTISEISIDALQIPRPAGARQDWLSAKGSLTSRSQSLVMRLSALTDDGSDVVNISINVDRTAALADVDIAVLSTQDGSIAALADLGGPITLSLKGAGPINNFTARLEAAGGAYGAVTGDTAINLDTLQDVSFVGNLQLGERLAVVETRTGENIAVAASLHGAAGTTTINLSDIRSEAMQLGGVVRITHENAVIQELSADLVATVDENRWREVQSFLGGEIDFTAFTRLDNAAYDLTSKLTTDAIEFDLRNGRSDLREWVTGEASLRIKQGALRDSPFEDGVDIDAAVNLDRRTIQLDQTKVRALDGTLFRGDVGFDRAGGMVDLEGVATLAPAIASRLAPAVSLREPVYVGVRIGGGAERLSLELRSATPVFFFNETRIPAAVLSANGTIADSAVRFDVSAEDRAASSILTAAGIRSAEGVIDISSMSVVSPNFALEGGATADPDNRLAAFDLSYRGDAGAQPWPGLTLEGRLDSRGTAAWGDRPSDIEITGQDLQIDGNRLAAIDATLTGPLNALRTSVAATGVYLKTVGKINAFNMSAIANLAQQPRIAITGLDTDLFDIPLTLRQETVLRFDDGLTISGVDAIYGADGAVTLDGLFAEDLWRGNVRLVGVPIQNTGATATLDLTLDTADTTPAHGNLRMISVFADEPKPLLVSDIVWDGAELKVTDTSGDSPLDLTLSLPLVLSRSPKVSVSTAGAVNGLLRYAGEAEAITPFLPAAAQSLEGDLQVDIQAHGTLAEPSLSGALDIRNGAYTELRSGAAVININGGANARRVASGAEIDFRFTGSGVGQTDESITAEGDLVLGDESAIDATVALESAAFSAGPVSAATASGNIALEGPLDTFNVRGAIDVEQLDAQIAPPKSTGLVDIDVIAVGADAPDRSSNGNRGGGAHQLDLSISAADRIFIRGRGIESEWSADVRAAGPANRPVILGSLSLRRGYIDFSGRRFQLTRGAVTFDALTPNDPEITVRAEYEAADGVLAVIEITGRASSPQISLVSSPPRAPDEVMALVLFGKPTRELSALESLQTAQALASLTGVGPFGGGGGFADSARQALGLDLLNIALDTDIGATTLEVGKYVADGLFVKASQDASGENGSVSVEYEITNSITVETELQNDGEQTVSANWKRDF